MGRSIANACYRELGMKLRKIREGIGMDSTELAHRLGWHISKVSRVEAGRVNLSDVDLLHYLGPLGVYFGAAHDLLALCREAMLNLGHFVRPHHPGLPEMVCSLIYHEATATVSASYEPEMVPGLLQTEAYARAVVRDRFPCHDLDLAVRSRIERQQILRRPDPARFTFFVHEHALRLTVGDNATMHEQMLTLMFLDGLSHVRIRVVRAPALFGGAFRLFRFAQHHPLVYLDAYVGGMFLEDPEYVGGYQKLVPTIADAALDEGQSREFLATLANEYDRGSVRDSVEEKQL